jgi:hypothetical protein
LRAFSAFASAWAADSVSMGSSTFEADVTDSVFSDFAGDFSDCSWTDSPLGAGTTAGAALPWACAAPSAWVEPSAVAAADPPNSMVAAIAAPAAVRPARTAGVTGRIARRCVFIAVFDT